MASSPAIQARTPTPQWMYLVLAIALIVAYALVRQQWSVPAHGGVDENCYLVAGKQIATTGRPEIRPDHPDGNPVGTFVGDIWVGQDLGTPSERYLPKYPPGMPLLVAGAMELGGAQDGLEFSYLISPIGYSVGLIFVFALAQKLAGSAAAFAAMAAAMVSAPLLRMFTSPNSHGISFALSALSAWLIAQWLTKPRWFYAMLAGAACAAAAAVRSGEIVLVVPLLIGGSLQVWESRRRWPLFLLALAGWASVAGATLGLQYWWTSQWSMYAATGESATFRLANVIGHLPPALWEILKVMGPFLPLGVVGLIMLTRRQPALGLALSGFVIANLILYCAWWWAPSNPIVIYSRLFLPSMAVLWPCGSAAVVWLLQKRALAISAIWLVVAVCVASNARNVLSFATLDTMGQFGVATRTKWLKDHVPPDAILLCDEPDILDHLAFASDYELYDARMFRREPLLTLVDYNPDWPLCLDPERRRFINTVLLTKTPEQLTDLRDQLVASYIRAGRRVYFFSGPEHKWAPFGSLSKYGLEAHLVATGKHWWKPIPTVPQYWGLEEVTKRP